MSVVEEVEIAVREYHEKYRNPLLEVPTPSNLYFLEKQSSDAVSKEYIWPARWPNAERPGIYVFLDADGDLLYIGKADNLGSRLSSYFRYAAGEICEVKDKWEPRQPHSLFTVPVSEVFEASSLEEYLIDRLRPHVNKKGKRR